MSSYFYFQLQCVLFNFLFPGVSASGMLLEFCRLKQTHDYQHDTALLLTRWDKNSSLSWDCLMKKMEKFLKLRNFLAPGIACTMWNLKKNRCPQQLCEIRTHSVKDSTLLPTVQVSIFYPRFYQFTKSWQILLLMFQKITKFKEPSIVSGSLLSLTIKKLISLISKQATT